MGFKLELIIIFVFILLMAIPIVLAVNDIIALQGNVKQSGVDISAGDIQVVIWDAQSGGNLLYNSTTDFLRSISSGKYDIMLGNASNNLTLEYGKNYFLELYVNGSNNFEKFTFDDGSTRQIFQSSVGQINVSEVNKTAGTNWVGQTLDTIIDTTYSWIAGVNTTANIQGLLNGTGIYNFNYNQTDINRTWAYNQSLSPTITQWLYNQSLSPTITQWLYNQSDGSFNTTYATYSYNQSLSPTITQWLYNQSLSPTITQWLYNQTTAGNDLFLRMANTAGTSVNVTGDLLINVSGNINFNSGWQSNGVSIIGGNIWAQTIFVYNLSSISISNLNINGSLLPASNSSGFVNNTFDIGGAGNNWWRNIYAGTDVYVGSEANTVKKWLYNQSLSPTITTWLYNQSLSPTITPWLYNMTTNSIYYYNQSLSPTITPWLYNQSLSPTITPWLYNQSLSPTITIWLYNQSDGVGNIFQLISNVNTNLTSNFSLQNLSVQSELYLAGIRVRDWLYNQSLSPTITQWLYNQSLSPTITQWLYNQSDGSFNSTYNTFAYNQTGGFAYNQTTATFNQYGLWWYNQSLSPTITPWLYNQSLSPTITQWLYNQSDGSFNTTYNTFAYNQTGGFAYNQTTATFNQYGLWWYNQSLSPTITTWLYNQTLGDTFSYNQSLSLKTGFWNATATTIFHRDLSDNIGIGTATPTQLLEISNPATSNADAFLKISNLYTASDRGSNIIFNRSTTGEARQWEVGTGLKANDEFNIYDRTAGAFRFNIDNTGNVSIDSPTFFIDANGNRVGIGTASPVNTLSIIGGDTTDGAPSLTDDTIGVLSVKTYPTTSGVQLNIGGYTANPFAIWIQSYYAVTDAVYPLSINPLGGNVGIGNTAPTQKLVVAGHGIYSGDLYVANTTLVNQWLYNQTLGDTFSYNQSLSLKTGFWNATATTIFQRDLSDNVGIGTATPTQKLVVNNNAPTTAGNSIAVNITALSANLIDAYGLNIRTVGDNDVNSAYGIYVNTLSAGNINYGIFINATGGSNRFGIYDVSQKSYFQGAVGIGTTVPSGKYALEINNNTAALNVSGNLYVNGSTVQIKVNLPVISTSGSYLCLEPDGTVTTADDIADFCNNGIASPFLYAKNNNGDTIFGVEFLANLNSFNKKGYQSVPLLDYQYDEYVIVEPKRETSYTDMIQKIVFGTYGNEKFGFVQFLVLEVNDERLREVDNNNVVLDKGENLTISFEPTPKDFIVSSAVIRVNGYYVPYS